jgi:carboxyl-terminal processing protease
MNGKERLIAVIFKILGMALIFWSSYGANSTVVTNNADCIFASSTAALINTQAEAITLEEERFNPAECFDKVWEIINNEFWDPNFNGVDWQYARIRYKPKALAAKDHESFAAVVNQMLGELKTSHTRYFTRWDPDYYTLQAALISASLAHASTLETSDLERYLSDLRSSQRDPHRSGIGVVTKNINGRHYVTAVLNSSPAEKAGILSGDWLVEVNGRPFHPVRSFENKAGREVNILIQRGPSETTRHWLKIIPVNRKEREMFEKDSHDRPRFIEHKDHRFAYVRLWWLNGRPMRQVLEYGINAAIMSEGIIIDIRDGFGGGPPVDYIQPFLKNGLETITEESIYRNRKFKSTASFSKPVVVLINGGSRSGKELLAYYFKKTGRGLLVGEQTAGYVTGGRKKRISKDSFLYYGVCMIVIDGKRLEGVGVEPDILVPFDVRFAAGRDVQLERAKDEIVRLIESGY